jgi:hypothetical protein
MRRGRRVRSLASTSVLECHSKRRHRNKNTQADSLRHLSSNSRSGLHVLHRGVFLTCSLVIPFLGATKDDP